MRKFLYLAVLLWSTGCREADRSSNHRVTVADTVPAAVDSNIAQPMDTALIVRQVKAGYAAVNSKKLKSRLIEVAEGQFEDDCGIVIARTTYYAAAGGPTEKISRWLGADAAENTTEYYYKDGKLFFIFSREEYYPPAPGEQKQVTELRVYLQEGVPVTYISSAGNKYQTADFRSEIREGNALFRATNSREVQEAICPAGRVVYCTQRAQGTKAQAGRNRFAGLFAYPCACFGKFTNL